jgi:SulP family sulfate permease
MADWLPRSVECLRTYSARSLARDAVAGTTVALVALPLAMAFGIASGVTPQAGIYTAIVAGFAISAFGGSRFQIGGPTGAFVVIVAGIVAKFGLIGLAMTGVMSGAILIVAGLLGLGAAITFIPRPVILGFTNGIAILIASTQLNDFFGLSAIKTPSAVIGRIAVLSAHAGQANLTAIAIALTTLALIVFFARVAPAVPGAVIAITIGTVAATLLHLNAATIGSAFGGIPPHAPPFTPVRGEPGLVTALIPSAVTVAFLAAVESLLSAVVADSLGGDRHKPNVEIVAQGIANILTPFFGGIPATGAIARTATNIRAGAVSPIAGIIHALILLVVLLVAAPLARFIPLAALAAILMMVAYHMGEWRHIGSMLRLPKADVAVWLVTFALTVFADLTVAIAAGIALAAIFHVRRIAATTTIDAVTTEIIESGRVHLLQDKIVPDNVSIVAINGPFLFGSAEKLEAATADVSRYGEVVIVRLRDMPAIDASGVYALERFAARLKGSGRRLLLCGAPAQPARVLASSAFFERLGSENVLPDIGAALERAGRISAGKATA